VRFRVEVANANLGAHDLIECRCGPILSLLKPADITKYSRGDTPRLLFRYQAKQVREGSFVPFVVLENVRDGGKTVVKSTKAPFGPRQSTRGGSDSVSIPASIRPGKYRVYYQFEERGRVVSIGHHFETTLPHGPSVLEPEGEE